MRLVVRVSDVLPAGRKVVQMVRIAGELDGETLPEAERALANVLAAAPPHVVLDLADLRFVTSVGVGLLLDMRRRLEEKGAVVLAVGMSPAIDRTFAIVQAQPGSRVFRTAAELDEYIAAIQPLPKGRVKGPTVGAEVRIGQRLVSGAGVVQVVRISGELDDESSRDVERALPPVVAAAVPHVNLDLADLTLISSRGVGVLLDLRRRLEAKGAVVVATGLRPSIERVFRILQVMPASHVFPSVAAYEAHLAALRRQSEEA